MYVISGPRGTLKLGMWSAGASAILFLVYDVVVFAGGAFKGVFTEPYLAIAEALSIIGACILIVLMATIHICAPRGLKVFSLIAFGWILLLVGFTCAVHFVNLTLLRQLEPGQRIEFVRFIGWEWPSMLYAIELTAWHLFFGMSMLFTALVFKGNGREKTVRGGLLLTGFLCLIGLSGPLIGNLNWRLMGAFSYGFIFPFVCIFVALIFKNAPEETQFNETNSNKNL
jgi:hypothetical protein